jgi:hypothetical protein
MRKVKTKDSERIYTGQFRKKRVLSIFPFIIMDGIKSDFHWTGKWFQYVTVKQQKIKDRYLEFNEGNYQNYWGKWETTWVFTKIMKNEQVNKHY